jgi:flagellar biosynthesis/type III secretory pathway M-ring protein FliF/YscJ
LEEGEELPQLATKDAATELVERVRQMTKREPMVAANVLRLWLMDSKG